MLRRLHEAVCLVGHQHTLVGAEAAAITSTEHLSLAKGNVWTHSTNGISALTLTVLRGATLIIMPRR